MKRSLLLVLVLFTLLSGCSLFQKQEPVPAAGPEETVFETKRGVVTMQTAGVDATLPPYVLQTETGEQIPIDSLMVNLKRYIKRTVELAGKWSDDKRIFVVESITSLTQETNVKQRYQNAEMGISFSYPSVWELREDRPQDNVYTIIITPYAPDEGKLETVDYIRIERVGGGSPPLSIYQWSGINKESMTSGVGTSSTVYQESSIGVALLPAVKKTSADGATIEFVVTRDRFAYIFTHVTVNDSDKDLYRNAFYDIVNGFEFIPFGKNPPTATLESLPSSSVTPLAKQPTLTERADEELARRAKEEEERRKLEDAQRVAEEEAAHAAQSAASLAETRKRFIDYAVNSISSLAEEPATMGGAWHVLSVEFAFPEGQPEKFNGLYVTYEDGHNLRKILLSVPDTERPESMMRIAYFKPGASTTWTLVSGTDTAKSSEKAYISIGGDQLSEVVVRKGMQLVKAGTFKVQIQAPASWYWGYVNGGYNFSDKPLSGENVRVRLTKNPESLPPEMSEISLEGRAFTEGAYAESYTVCAQLSARFCLSGEESNEDTMKSMIVTLLE